MFFISSNSIPWFLNVFINTNTARNPLIKKNVSTPKIAPSINWIAYELCKLSKIWTILSAIVNWKTNEWPSIIQNNEIARIPFKKEYVEEFLFKEKIFFNVVIAEYSLRWGINEAKHTNKLSKIIKLNVNIVPNEKYLRSDLHWINNELKLI